MEIKLIKKKEHALALQRVEILFTEGVKKVR